MKPLSPGTRVGAWRVKALAGHGVHGAVYRAERGGLRRSQPGALKVSLSRWNWRMEREVELLSRLSHPSIPRLLDRGGVHSPTGEELPFFVIAGHAALAQEGRSQTSDITRVFMA